jgi:uncharacterized protein YbjT (DUF2867 family)
VAASVLVTGGTGMIGSHVLPELLEKGVDTKVLTRSPRTSTSGVEYVTGDLVADAGIDDVVTGAEVVLHLAGGPKDDDIATRHLVDAAKRAGGVKHLVYISVIGADKLPISYFKAKANSERVIAESGLPFSTLRAAQCHEFVVNLAQKMSKMPVAPIPSVVRFQPVAGAEVAARLLELALGSPVGRVPDIAGPKVYPMADLVRSCFHALGKRRWIMPVPLPGRAGRVYRAGENLTLAGAQVGRQTWEEFLASSVPAA